MAGLVKALTKTCEAFPAQWEGQLEDGRWVYIRVRYGILSVGFGETRDAAISDGLKDDGVDVGNEHFGEMNTFDMLSIVRMHYDLAPPATCDIALDRKSIKCLVCSWRSWNPNDVDNRYCGRCHAFHPQRSPVS